MGSNRLGLSRRGSGEAVTFFDKFSRLFSSVFQRTGVPEIHTIRQNTPPDEREADAAEQSVAGLTAPVASQNGSRIHTRSLVCLVPVLLDALDMVDQLGMLAVLSA